LAEKKELKINIKNTQIAQAIQLDKLKKKLAGKKADAKENKLPATQKTPPKAKKAKEVPVAVVEKDDSPRRKARSKSAFAEPQAKKETNTPIEEKIETIEEKIETVKEPVEEIKVNIPVTPQPEPIVVEKKPTPPAREVLGPTGRHINDLLPPKPVKKHEPKPKALTGSTAKKGPAKGVSPKGPSEQKVLLNKPKSSKFREFRDVKPTHKQQNGGRFDARDRRGLRAGDDNQRWRKKRSNKSGYQKAREDLTVRPSSLSIRLPITVKDLASEMKLKASQLIQKLFLQGIAVTINDALDDETTIQLLGHEFECEITIDTSEEERKRITDQSIKEEILSSDENDLVTRAPVVTFMGHVDHGKTSLIDYIRKSNTVHAEAGAITQHIGAFKVNTSVGDIAILDTPGHEAFSSMRARGANVTDIVVLVIAGDEGMRAQTEEAIDHAKAAGVTIIVALNKCDKPNFDPEKVYRQLADHNLLPESWGGSIITVNCSAVSGEGIQTLLEMLALQAEVLELKANPKKRARGTVLESELHKGMGSVATILIQNGTLRLGDALVFGEHYGRVKTMRDEFGNNLKEAPPSTPIEITGISGVPDAGSEFIVVDKEKEARDIAEARQIDKRQLHLQQTKASSLESLFQKQAEGQRKKVLKIILRADVQGSLEALKVALLKIESEKADIDIISSGVGEISESDVLLAAASNAIIIGFHIQVESHAEQLVKQHKVKVSQHDIIYHAIDDVKALMTGLLDKVSEETDRGKAEVRATFKASQLGVIAGCIVTEGTIHRNHSIRIVRNGEVIWTGPLASIKRVQEDVREVQKGVECGIVLQKNNDIQEGDILEAFEVTYLSQQL